MSALSIQPTYPIFTDIDGQPLEAGYVWIGTANLDPQTNPINVYWDAALTILATQPIRTLAGYPANNGTPARLYVNSDYSIRVMNKNGSVVYSAPAATERYSSSLISFTGFKGQVGTVASLAGNDGSDWIGFLQDGAGAVARSAQDKARDTINILDFGASTAAPDNTAFIQAALDEAAARGGAIVEMPAGTFTIAGTLTVKSNTKFCGVSMGYGTYSSTVIRYTGSGVAIQIGEGSYANGFYSKLQGFKLVNGGATAGTTVGIYIRATQTEIEDVTVMDGGTAAFNDGIKTDYAATTFTHIMRRVYVYGCGTGFYLRKVNNVVLDACFIESNNTGVYIVEATNISLVNGCVLECFGDGRAAETNTSCCIEANGVTGLTVRDWYSEVAPNATTAIGQQFIRLQSVNGGCIDSGYMYTQSDNSIAYPLIELKDANVKNIAITNNSFNRLGADAYVVGASGGGSVANVYVANNFYTSNAYDYNPNWTPTILIGGSSTGITYSSQVGDWWREGNSIVVSGQITLSSKGSNTGVVTIDGLPLPMQRRLNAQCFGVLMVSNATALSASQTFCRATSNSSQLRLQYRLTSSTNETAYTDAELSNTAQIQFQITYPVEP